MRSYKFPLVHNSITNASGNESANVVDEEDEEDEKVDDDEDCEDGRMMPYMRAMLGCCANRIYNNSRFNRLAADLFCFKLS